MKYWFLKRLSPLFYILAFLLPTTLLAKLPEFDYMITVKLNLMIFAKDNNFLLQCIIALLLVMILGYNAKLLYETKINKE
jgi:hypothetical protein